MSIKIMEIQESISLAPYTTFRIGGIARYFAEIQQFEDISQAFRFAREKGLPTLVLGGGSNMLVSDNGFDGLVLHMGICGLELYEDKKAHVICEGAAGETWDDVVALAAKKNLWGIENLSYVPGTLGGAPIQNIGAYGQEFSSVVEAVEAYDVSNDEIVMFNRADCGFGYRSSIFNTSAKGRYLVTSVTFRLMKEGEPNLSYAEVAEYCDSSHPSTPQEMRNAIISIRKRKLHDPKEIGNAGSFFKNIQLDEEEYAQLEKNVEENIGKEGLSKLREIKGKINASQKSKSSFAKASEDDPLQRIKIPTALLIDLCGLKGRRIGGAKISDKQALVIVNESGQATAQDVLGLFNEVRTEVNKKIAMKLVNEPELVGFGEEVN